MFRSEFLPTRSNTGKLSLGSVLAAFLLSLASSGQAEGCRLALILALDVSGSISRSEDRLQREGLAAALLAPEVRRAFLTGGDVAIYVFEWADAASQVALLPGWVVIRDAADLVFVASVVVEHKSGDLRATPNLADGTAVGSALVHAAWAFSAGPDCRARTVDVSGDGVNSQGIDPGTVIDALYDNITVNALVIDRPIQDPMQEIWHGGDQQLATWFEQAVVHGPGAFHVLADSYDDYQQAMTVKLLREVQSAFVSGLPGASGRT